MIPQQKEQHSTVAQWLPRDRVEILGEAPQECAFVEVSIEGIASATQLAEANVGCRNPLHNSPACREFIHQPRDLCHGNLVDQQQVMNQAEHQYQIETAASPIKQRARLRILPTESGGGSRSIGDDGKYWQSRLTCTAPVLFGRSYVCIPCNHVGS